MTDKALTLLAGSAINFKEYNDAFLARFEKTTSIIVYQTSTTKTKFVFINEESKERLTAVGVESTALNWNKILVSDKDMTVQTTYHEGSDLCSLRKDLKSNLIKVIMMPLKAAYDVK